MIVDIIKTDPAEDRPPPALPERGLIAGIINQAFSDACQKTTGSENASVAHDAMDFLMSSRSDLFFSMLKIDAGAAREALIKKTAHFPEYAKFRYWLRFWKSGIRLNEHGKVPAGRRVA